MFETNTSILNELLTVTTNDLLLHLPKVAIPKKLKRSATVNGIRTFTKVSSNQHNAPQDMATDNLAAGVHTSTTKEDIRDDLVYSGINVCLEEIEKKTRQDLDRPPRVDSYKITVKAEDVQKSLSSDVWALYVKCRIWKN